MDISASTNRTLDALAWGVPVVVAPLIAAPFDRYFFSNFVCLAILQLPPLLVLAYFELRQPEFAATAGALAAFPFLLKAYTSFAGGEWWFGQIILLPGFVAGSLFTLVLSQRTRASGKSVVLAVGAPYVGIAAEFLLFGLVEGK